MLENEGISVFNFPRVTVSRHPPEVFALFRSLFVLVLIAAR
jgi:hypothetical protein